MSNSSNIIPHLPTQSPFERIRQVDEDEQEFWSARDLMPILEYTKWQNFKTILLKAQIACENSGNNPSDHFTDASKMVEIRSDSQTRESQRRKMRAYLKHGVKMGVLVLPGEAVEVYRPDHEVLVLSVDDTLDGGDVLTGFKLPLDRILP